jgi:hypothetical protein
MPPIKKNAKRNRYCQLPAPMSVTGRSSSITNAFVNAIIPVIEPTEEEELEAPRILHIDPMNIRCAYCGDKYTEMGPPSPHHQQPGTDGIHYGDSKPGSELREMQSIEAQVLLAFLDERSARLSPKSRGIPDLPERVARLQRYEAWREPHKIDFAKVVGQEMWLRHRKNWRSVLDLLKESHELATEIRTIVAKVI